MAAEDPKADRKASRDEFKKQFELGARKWKQNGGQGAYVPYSLMFGLLGAGNKVKKDDEPKIEDPPLPPADGGSGGSGGTTPAGSRPASNNWPDIVAHYFPKGAGTQYNEGGLVRGGGCAAKGRGRGRIV
jgi:hypothetical protein